ncbi:MAG TPA: glycosyltransferase [Kiritimatiellia bacterium]|nr:glycosyltransferase [Kiritimatiellia bacterium]
MKLVFIIDNPRIIGGGDYAMFKYAEHMALRGHTVSVHGQYYNEFMDQLRRPEGFQLRLRGGVPPIVRGAGYINRAWDWVHRRLVLNAHLSRADQRPDFLIGYHRRSAIKACDLGRTHAIPVANVVFETPTWLSKVFGERFDQRIGVAEKREWEAVRKAYCESAVIFPLSGVVRSEVSEWTNRIVNDPIYCGVNDPGALEDNSIQDSYILYIGRLDANKNVHEIIDAVSRLDSPTKLIIAGGGYDEPDLKQRAVELNVNCEFKGHVTDEEKWRLIQNCLFMVFPSSFEGFGIPPAESLVCGKPCICSDIPVLREVYADYVEMIPEHHVDRMVDTMKKLLANPDYRKERGLAGRKFVLSKYTWAKCAERMEHGLLALV